jgi:hypothetical protein
MQYNDCGREPGWIVRVQRDYDRPFEDWKISD